MKVLSFTATFMLIGSIAAGMAQTPDYKITNKIGLGSPDRWDYLVYDQPSHRLYVAHGDRVTVLDGHSGKLIGNVEGVGGISHGIGIVPSLGKGYTDDGEAGLAVRFDLETLKPLKRIKVEDDADGIVFDKFSGHIFVIGGDALTVIDPRADMVIGTINAGGSLEYAVSGGNGKLYVDGAENEEIVRIDTATNRVDAHWKMAGCTRPHGLAIDLAAHRLFASCANAVLTVVNADTGAVIATLPIGHGTDGAAFDPKRKLVFASNYDGTVSVFHEDGPQTFKALGSIHTAVTGRTMTIDQETGRLFVAAGDVDPKAPIPLGHIGRPKPLPGSLKILFLDPPDRSDKARVALPRSAQ